MDIHKKTHVSFIIQLRLNNEKTALNFTVISVGEWIFLVLIRGLKVWDKSNNFNWISGLLWTVCSSYTVHEWMRQKMWQRASSSTFQWSQPPTQVMHIILKNAAWWVYLWYLKYILVQILLHKHNRIWVVEDENDVTESDRTPSGRIFWLFINPLRFRLPF